MRIIKLLFTLTVVTLAASSTGAYEEQAEPEDGAAIVAHLFEVSDLDEDGILSSDEYDEAGLADFGLSFEACDRDADGVLTSEEYLELYRQHHPAHPGLDV